MTNSRVALQGMWSVTATLLSPLFPALPSFGLLWKEWFVFAWLFPNQTWDNWFFHPVSLNCTRASSFAVGLGEWWCILLSIPFFYNMANMWSVVPSMKLCPQLDSAGNQQYVALYIILGNASVRQWFSYFCFGDGRDGESGPSIRLDHESNRWSPTDSMFL